MRHRKSINHLGRTSSHRKAMLSNLASSLILHKRITTTVAKAKALRMYVEPLITKAKDDSTHSRRIVFSFLQNKEAVTELFREVSKKVGDRPGGYTRILKLGQRLGDNADMAFMELVDYNENMLSENEASKGKSKRRRSRGGKKTEETTAVVDKTAKVEEKAEAKAEAVNESEPAIAAVEENVASEQQEVEDSVKEAPAEEIVAETVAEAKEEPKEESKPEEKVEAKAEAKKVEAKDDKATDTTEEEKK